VPQKILELSLVALEISWYFSIVDNENMNKMVPKP